MEERRSLVGPTKFGPNINIIIILLYNVGAHPLHARIPGLLERAGWNKLTELVPRFVPSAYAARLGEAHEAMGDRIVCRREIGGALHIITFTWGVSSKYRRSPQSTRGYSGRSLAAWVRTGPGSFWSASFKLVTPTNAPARHRGTSAALDMIIGRQADWDAAHDYRPLTRW